MTLLTRPEFERDAIMEELRLGVQTLEVANKALERKKAAAELERDQLKAQVVAMKKKEIEDTVSRKALLFLVGILRHDVEGLYKLGNDDTLEVEQYVDEAIRVISRIHSAMIFETTPSAVETNGNGASHVV